MSNFALGLLYSFGFLGVVVASGMLVYRAFLLGSFTSATTFAVIGVVFALASTITMFIGLYRATIHAVEKREGVLWKGPLMLIVLGLATSVLAIHLSGLGVGNFFIWADAQVRQWFA